MQSTFFPPHRKSFLAVLLVCGLFYSTISGCNDSESSSRIQDNSSEEEYAINLPDHFPPLPVPEDNALRADRIELGRLLFYDPILSRDTSVSCGSCHFQHRAFTTPDPIAIGIDGKKGLRNAMSLVNLSYHSSFFRDGGVPTLEMQILAPVEDSLEMDLPLPEAAERLRNIPEYVRRSKEAYGREPDPFVITRSIAAFERTLISFNSPYDHYLSGEESALTDEEKLGMKLFFSDRVGCADCHSGFNFSDEQFHNNGLYLTYEDSGRARVTMLHKDVGEFKVPTLRNVELTGPYMHDGSISSLSGVLDHYTKSDKGHWNLDTLIRPLNLTLEERGQIIAFLKALTDTTFTSDPKFSDPLHRPR